MMAFVSHTHGLGVLCVVLTIVASADIVCPKGARIHLGSWRCYWLTEAQSSLVGAQDSCRQVQGGDLASAGSLELQRFIHSSFPQKTTVWIWVKESDDGSQKAGVMDPAGSSWWDRGGESQGVCVQMALGTPGHWRKALCSGRHLFLCENDVTEFLPSGDTFLTGLILMSGVYMETQIKLLPNVPHLGHQTVEIQLFPGMWFSHAGQLVSVQLVVQPSPVSSMGRLHILRPYCSPNQHLVPPGCSSVLNPFSYCSSQQLCNTTGACSLGQHWCHLTESCLYTTNPCSPYNSVNGAHYALPPRYPAIPPFYHLAVDMPIRMNPSSELQTLKLILPDKPIMVYPDDIVAIQHTRNAGTFLHCLSNDASMDSPWRQSYMSLRGSEWGGWWEGSAPLLPQAGRWVDGVTCDLKILYVDNLQSGTEHNDLSLFNLRETTAVPDIRVPKTGLRSSFGLTVIHPVPDKNNQIHVKINDPILIVIKVSSGQGVFSSWSAPVLQTGVPFLPSCPEEVLSSCPGCMTHSHDDWFSSVTLVLPSVGPQTMNITAMDAVSSQILSVKVRGYEAVTGLTIESHGCPRMLVNTPQSFTAKVERGSSVQFTWVIDDLEKSTHEGESYSVVFKKSSQHKLKITASNPVSSQIEQILLIADDVTPMADPEFLLVRNVVAVNVPNLFTIRVKVDTSVPLTFIWNFGDGLSNVIHTKPAPCQTLEEHRERREKQAYVQDSVNFTYSQPDDYEVHVQVSDQYDNRDVFMKMKASLPLSRLLISSSPPTLLAKQRLFLDVATYPTSCGVSYTWDFGDSSEIVRDVQQQVSHAFPSAGFYNITVSANNTLTVLSAWHMVEVSVKISGLTVSNSGPSELNYATNFTATVATGTSLTWTFEFGDGSLMENLADGSVSHIYQSLGVYTARVTVWNAVSRAHQSITTEVYRLAVSRILPTKCVESGRDTQLTAQVNGDISALAFHWLFGDGSDAAIVKGRSVVTHRFTTAGTFQINLTVFSAATSTSFNTTLCVEVAIVNITVLSSQDVVAVGAEVCLRVLLFPLQMTGCQLKWLTGPSSLMSRAEDTQRCFAFGDEGVEEVSVIATNNISIQTAVCRIAVQKPVKNFFAAHDISRDTLTVDTAASFWVVSCLGSNVSVFWDFGDGSPVEFTRNVSHVFALTGDFRVTATAFNAISRDSVTFSVNVLFPVSDLSIHVNPPYGVVGEEAVFTAVSSAVSGNTRYFWIINGINSSMLGTHQFGFTFLNPGVYQVRVIAKNSVRREEAAYSLSVFEIIEGLQIKSQAIIGMKYVPTHQNLLFVPSVTKGSNITYHWLATQSKNHLEMTGEGDIFQISAETPGRISVQVTASNFLGEASRNLSLEGVERLKGALITAQSNMVALGEGVNISVSVTAGSDLRYLWHVKPNHPPVETNVSFFLHTFTTVGHSSVTVSVRNAISQSDVTKDFTVQEEVQEVDFEIDGGTCPFYIPARCAVTLHGLNQKGSNLHWSWKFGGAAIAFLNQQTSTYSFPHAGIYQVALNISNRVSWIAVSHNVTVQDPIEQLVLTVSKASSCSGEEVTFVAAISRGSDVSFVITFRNRDWVSSQNIPGGRFTTSSLPAGKLLVTVKAWNRVSSAEAFSSVLIIDAIQGLRIVSCCSVALEAEKEHFFKSEIQSRGPVNYTWQFHLANFEPMWLTGQEVVFTPLGSGSLSISLLASDGVCSQSVNGTTAVQWPINNLSLACQSDRIFVGHAARFSASVSNRANASFHWDFGDSTDLLATDSDKVTYTYHAPGNYSIVAIAVNNVSRTTAQLQVEVEVLQCSSPQVSLVRSWSTIIRSRTNYFEASVVSDCSAYSLRYQWEVLALSATYPKIMLLDNKVRLRGQKAASPLLSIPKHTLSVGQYCLLLTVSLQGTPLHVQQNTTITVVNAPLLAVIKGGSKRLWPSLTDLTLDGSDSQDLDREPGEEDMLKYDWAFVSLSSPQSQLIKQTIESKSSRVTIPSTQLHPGTGYIFTLTVHKMGRMPMSVNQTVIVCGSPVIPVAVRCVSCSVPSSAHYLVSHTLPVNLSGHCEQCDGQTEYTWGAEDQAGLVLDVNDIVSPTESTSPNLELQPGVLQPGHSYTFTVNVSQPHRGRWGSASVTIRSIALPRGGLCDFSPESEIRLLETVVAYNCSGWQQIETKFSQLIYTFQVKPCEGTTCPPLTLYKGTRSAFASLLPLGRLGRDRSVSVVTAAVLIEDHLGTTVVALKKTLTVKNPVREDAAGQWLANKSRTELRAVVQHGNPQDIIPYAIALTSHLNQMDREITAKELVDRTEIRKNVTLALTSLPVSSLLDVEQMTSALLQSTAVPSEMTCEDCQKKVLKTAGKLIHVLEEQASPGVFSAETTGSKILNLIGNTLAAASNSVTRSRSDLSLSSALQSAPSVVLSALDLTGVLMRAMVRLQGPQQAPVLLSAPNINTVGFHGDPAHLLCSKQNIHLRTSQMSVPCQFSIPSSFTAHLRSQKYEVVQVLLDIDVELASDPLATAAEPPISTALVAMELSTPQGKPIAVQHLEPEQAIRVTLPKKRPAGQDTGSAGRKEGGTGNETCLAVSLPTEGSLNFTVEAVDGLVANTGLYISFNFSLDAGATTLGLGHVKIEVSAAVPGFNASQNSLVRECTLSLSDPSKSAVESIFLSPLWNGTGRPLSVNLVSSMVDPGPVHVSVCVFSSLCQYYSQSEGRWRSDGLQPLEGSTLLEVHCLTKHLTMFGASLFVHPEAVILLPPSSGPVRNMVVAIVCVVLVLLHLVVGIMAHKMDCLDGLRLKQVPLCGAPGLFQYRVLVKTGWRRGSGTTAHVGISLYGVRKSGCHHLHRDGAFQRGSLDQFLLETDENLGEIWKVRIWHDNTGLDPSWYIQHVVVWDSQTDHMFFFLLEDWLSVDNHKNNTVEKEVLASCPEELSEFRRVFTSQLLFGLFEHHLWVSLWEHPATSCFTRSQRVTCSALVLHLYLVLSALWYGAVGTRLQGEPTSAQVPFDAETVAVGMIVALLVFPLQSLLCFLLRKTQCQVTVDTSSTASPDCHSVEMDVHIGHLSLSGASFLSLPDSSELIRGSHSSLRESKVFDPNILNFWVASGLAPQPDGVCEKEEGTHTWPSYDSLLNIPAPEEFTDVTPDPNNYTSSPVQIHQLRRKKALTQLRLAPPLLPPIQIPLEQKVSPVRTDLHKVRDHNLATTLTWSEENLMMCIAADNTNSSSDSGRNSPKTPSLLSNTWCTSCSSWPEQRQLKPLWSANACTTPGPQSGPSFYEPGGLYRHASQVSVDSMASTLLPSISLDSGRSPSATRIGVARGQPTWLLPPCALRVIYPVVGLLLAACLVVVVLYGSLWPRNVVLLWLISTFSAFLTSALLLEPLKICLQALICTTIWRPVDPEVEDHLALETTVVRTSGVHSRRVRPPYGYGLLRAKQEAHKVQTLRSLMKHCMCQLLFLLLVLMVNYQDRMEQCQARLLHSAIRRSLHTAPSGTPNLTALTDWSDVKQWVIHTLVPHLHQNPLLSLVGLPQLQYTHALSLPESVFLEDTLETRQLTPAELSASDCSMKLCKTLSIQYTHYHRESGLFMCVSIQLERVAPQRLTSSLSIHPLLIPSSSGPDLQMALMVLLLLSAFLILFREMRSMSAERTQYFYCCKHWIKLTFGLLSMTTVILQFCFQSHVRSCLSELRSQGDTFINFHRAACLAQKCSQSAAILLTLLILKLLGTLRFARRWMLLVRVLQRSRRELWAMLALFISLSLVCTHLGIMLFSHSEEGFLSLHQAVVSLLSLLRGHTTLRNLCEMHPILSPLFRLLLTFGSVWFLAKLCGAALISAYRAEKADLYHPSTEPQGYELVEFFIRRIKLWLGLTKAKEFRHRVKFEGMDIPPSRLSQESHISTMSSSLSPSQSSSFSSPCTPPSALSVRSEDRSMPKSEWDVQPPLECLLPCVDVLLRCFDLVNQVTEDISCLEMKLEEALARRRKKLSNNEIGVKEKPGCSSKATAPGGQEPENKGIRSRKIGVIHPKPRVSLPSSSSFTSSTLHRPTPPMSLFWNSSRNRYSESMPFQRQASSNNLASEAAKLASGTFDLYPAGSLVLPRSPRRRAWHSGSSHSADAAQRSSLSQDGVTRVRKESYGLTSNKPCNDETERGHVSDGVPVKRKAWT